MAAVGNVLGGLASLGAFYLAVVVVVGRRDHQYRAARIAVCASLLLGAAVFAGLLLAGHYGRALLFGFALWLIAVGLATALTRLLGSRQKNRPREQRDVIAAATAVAAFAFVVIEKLG